MTVETQSIIDEKFSSLLDEILASIRIGLCEEIGPNDYSFDEMLEAVEDEVRDVLDEIISETFGS